MRYRGMLSISMTLRKLFIAVYRGPILENEFSELLYILLLTSVVRVRFNMYLMSYAEQANLIKLIIVVKVSSVSDTKGPELQKTMLKTKSNYIR